MSKADEKLQENGFGIRYKKGNNKCNIDWIILENDNVEIRIGSHGLIFLNSKSITDVMINFKDLSAINEKCRELGWIK